MRELPTLFRTLPSADVAGNLSVWCHPLTIDDAPTRLALLFSSPCPVPVRKLLVGPDKQRHHCVLEDGFPMILSAAQAQLAARWLVGSLDLTQAGNAGEPLHASFNAPKQLLVWHHLTGTFTPNPAAEVPATREIAVPDSDSSATITAWLDHRCASPDEPRDASVDKLAEIITSIVHSIEQEQNATSADTSASDEAIIVTVDLDRTLWKGECLDWPVGSFKQHSETAVFDKLGKRFLELHAEVPLVLAALKKVRSASCPPLEPRSAFCRHRPPKSSERAQSHCALPFELVASRPAYVSQSPRPPSPRTPRSSCSSASACSSTSTTMPSRWATTRTSARAGRWCT